MEIHERIEKAIESHGYMLQSICTAEPPSYSYTIGFNDKRVVSTDEQWPEFIITGVHPSIAYLLILDIKQHYEELDHLPKAGDILSGIATMPTKLGAVSDENIGKYMQQALYRAERRNTLPVTALQIIWPDEERRFPDDPAFNGHLRHSQPLLG